MTQHDRWASAGSLALLFSLAACIEAPPPRPATITGLIDAAELDISAKVAGRLKAVPVREGERVGAGQLLAEIDSPELDAKMSQAQAALNAVEAKQRMARRGARDEERKAALAQRDAARAQLDLAEKTYQRMVALRDQGSIPASTFDEVESKMKLAREQLAAAEMQVRIAITGARAEELEALEATRQQALGAIAEVTSYQRDLKLVAPIGATVASVVLRPGELAATGYPVVTLVDLDDVWATFPVREDLLGGLEPGSRIEVEVPALGRLIEMEVFNLSVMGDFATWKATSERDGFDLKSFEVKARPTEKVEGLRPGMSARWMPPEARARAARAAASPQRAREEKVQAILGERALRTGMPPKGETLLGKPPVSGAADASGRPAASDSGVAP